MLSNWTRIPGGLGAFLAYDALQASDDGPIGKNIDPVGAEPSCHANVRISPYQTAGHEDIKNVLDTLISKPTFTLVHKLPNSWNAITGRWLLKWKPNEHNKLVRTQPRSMVMRGSM